MCLRSLKTLAVRMRAHEANALAVARFLEAHPKIAAVRFTGLPSHPQHALANRQMSGHGGMLTCNVAGDLDATRRFLQSVRVFALAESLGGVESLIEHPAIMTHASLPQSVRESARHRRQPGAFVGRHRSRSGSAARPRSRARRRYECSSTTSTCTSKRRASIDRAAMVPGMYLAWCVNLQLVAPKLEASFGRDMLRLRYRELTPAAFFLKIAGGRLTHELLSEHGSAFRRSITTRSIAAKTAASLYRRRKTIGIPTTRLQPA